MHAEATATSEPAVDPLLVPRWVMLGSLTLPGRPEHVSEARRFIARAIGNDPRRDSALIMTSELVTNAILHSRSKLPGGTVSVVAGLDAAHLIVTVTDNGSDWKVPTVRNRPGADSGNGLLLVESLADAWGYLHNEQSTTVWFRSSVAGTSDPPGACCALLADAGLPVPVKADQWSAVQDRQRSRNLPAA